MYINFDDFRPDTPRLDRSLTTLEVFLLTLLAYACLVIMVLVWPHLPFVKAWQAEQQARLQAALQHQQDMPQMQYVFSVPKSAIEKQPLRRPDLSDETHRAQTIERPRQPKNDRPFSRGTAMDNLPAQRPTPQTTTASAKPDASAAPPVDPNAFALPKAPDANIVRNDAVPHGPSTGVLSDAIRHVDRYTQGETLQNPQGGADLGPSIQFDTKGVDFGWWMRRFRAQVYHNWAIPYAAMALHGHVVISFWIHKGGQIEGVQILQPSSISAFTQAAYNAIIASNPTIPLPAEYPDEKGQMTVIFYYNETPPGGGQ
ncbi:MAG TPA: TonB family protein [Vicinamibacterales bacterium]|jgi:TonB family protein